VKLPPKSASTANVFVHPNADGSFTVGKERGKNVEAFRVDAYGLLDLIWLARRAVKHMAAEGGDELALPASASTGRP
jgi:hypothetical protein